MRFLRSVAWAIGALWVALGAHAQSPESDLTPESAHRALDSSAFVIPDVSDKTLDATRIDPEHKRFSVKFGLVMLADYTSFRQDAASVAQVGEQLDKFEARSIRLMARGHFELLRDWNYMVSYEYNGFDRDDDRTNDWAATDFRISTDLGGPLGTLTLGKMKEPHVYEMAGDAANLPHHERLLSPFFRSRNVGVQLSNDILDKRATWSVGWYNDWWVTHQPFATSGNDFAARVTALPIWEGGGANYLHLAASVRYYSAVDNQLRYRGKPASNVASDYVDTGKIAGDHAWHTGLEALWNVGPYSLLGEVVQAHLVTYSQGTPVLSGYYMTASWVITGEHRPYDRTAAYARRVLPTGQWGAWEVIGRIGRVDLNDGAVQGGKMNGWWAGVNWWATRRWKASIGYGNIDLDRAGQNGNTRTLLTRLQWIY